MATTYYVAIFYNNQRPEIATVTDAYKIYCDLGGLLKQKEFTEKIKEYDGVSLGFDNGETCVTFTASLLTKQPNAEFKGITTLVDIDTDEKYSDYEND